ncbi:dienelactone hydrolase-like enzyme [Pseudomonas sp. GM102]|uniref:dienelactone hydrolase family protein n=1 Tax=Pseudomonas sp. GM102 TaxID=1144321 RepID=UPI00026F549B|nr:dienelactone hydrolase family protein [Pseudomonas sp. GM102]EJM03025.1 dienelactone hydrolase-like enzyme [Pseudomonas sp. GM102]
MIQTQALDYRDGDVICKGQLVLPAGDDSRPGIVVFPDISGIGEHPLGKANRLAEELGYLVLVADVYGDGKAPPFPEAGEVVASWLSNSDKLAVRAAAALNALKAHPRCNGRLGAIGFCFGGATVLALTRSGNSDLLGGVSFHGVLATPKPAVPGVVKTKLLVLHGADDPFAGDLVFFGQGGEIQSKTVLEFTQEMSAAGVDCQTVSYSGVVHAFTIPAADSFGTPGAKYDAVADRRSWKSMADFLNEVL